MRPALADLVDPFGLDASARLLPMVEQTRLVTRGVVERLRPAQLEMLGLRRAAKALVDDWRRRMPEVLDGVRAKQRERIDKLDIEADPARLEVELALIAQKLDVDEELDRLDSHIIEIRSALGAGAPVGRRLDFLMQELNREANTLGSKSAATDTTRIAVELKVLIEQMREQIQNVE